MAKSAITLTTGGKFGATGILVNAIGTSCQLRQTVEGRELVVGNNEHQGTLAGVSAAPRVLPALTSTRTVLLPLAAGTTAEQVLAALAATPGATLYTMRSTDVRDILGSNQLAAMAPGAKNPRTLEEFQKAHTRINPTTGEAMPYYEATYFSATPKDDVDFRVSAGLAPAAALTQAAAAAPAAPVAVGVEQEDAL